MKPSDYAINKLAALENGTAIPATSTRAGAGGPRTPEGKKRSSQNATQHGLAGRTVVMPYEDMALYNKHAADLLAELSPQTALERQLAQTVLDGYWRMKRVRTVEEGMFGWGQDESAGNFDAENEIIHAVFTAAAVFRDRSNAFVNLTTYEGRIQRGVEKAMKQLKELQAERRARREAEILETIRLRNYEKMMAGKAHAMAHAGQMADTSGSAVGESQTDNRSAQNAVTDATYRVNKFVYSTPELETEILRRDRLTAALLAENAAFNYTEYMKKAA